MGTPIKDIEPGIACGHWDPPDETPADLYCFFWDIKKGDRVGAREPPNGHIFKLPQKLPLPCDWFYSDLAFDWEISFFLHAAQMGIDLRDAVTRSKVYFYQAKPFPPLDEYELFTNFYQDPFGKWGYGGYAIVFWMPDIIALAATYGLDLADDLMLELLSVSTTELIIKFCSLTHRVNVKTKISM